MLKILDTLTREKREFKPLNDKQVSFYHCGPTVYWTQHIGNMRAMVLADFVRRSLEFLGYNVKMVRNYTDVGHLVSDSDEGEDKMEKAAKREKLTPEQIAEKYTKVFDDDIAQLNTTEPEIRPKATEHIEDMKAAIKILLDKGVAYETDLAIYFDVSKFENYGQLTGQKIEEKVADSGKAEVSDVGKKNPADFALWFFKTGKHENAIQTWSNTPLNDEGEGFPGWHSECSVMSQKYLGETIDLHMGGIEHIPIHHPNEIAQAESVTGKKFVNYWLHNEHLLVNDGKMAKSEGTSYSLTDVKEKGYDPLVLRYFFLGAHYRSKQNFTWEALDGAVSALNSLRDKVLELQKYPVGAASVEYLDRFKEAISDDFNTPQALAVMWDMIKSGIGEDDKLGTILEFDKVFGLKLDQVQATEVPAEVTAIAEERQQARTNKDWQKSDKLRDKIAEMGFEIDDSGDGYIIKAKK